MNSGKLNKKIKLYKYVITKNAKMQEVKGDPILFSANQWAQYISNTASAAMKNGRLEMLNEGRFVVRWSKKLQQFIDEQRTTFEIEMNRKRYKVLGITNDNEDNKTFTITVEVKDGGN